jgi:LacI family transcriptional regulator
MAGMENRNGKSVTITDVAKAAGVSISTVSRVTNGSAPVTEELRNRVLKAMAELGYRPSILAPSLRELPSIGVIIPDISTPFFARVVQGIEDVCLANNHPVLICNAGGDPEREVLYADELSRLRVGGVIFAGAWGWEYDEHIAELHRRGIPLCLINREVSDLAVDMVLVDKTMGNYEATSHLLNLGHTAIACISGIPSAAVAHERVRGYRRAMEEAGIGVDESLIVHAQLSVEGGYRAGRELLMRERRPSAIFARTDLLALGVLHAAWDLGIRVPDELSVVGFDDSPLVDHVTPPLTTIRQPQYEMGAKAATLLFERMANSDLPQRQIIIQPRLILRQTTAAHNGMFKEIREEYSFDGGPAKHPATG